MRLQSRPRISYGRALNGVYRRQDPTTRKREHRHIESLTFEDLEAALPDVSSTIRAPGLRESVDVVRDRWGIPHIRAASEHDAFFAQGFVTAQDRLWHMDYDRHRALGRWSELAGESGLLGDRLSFAFGFRLYGGLLIASAVLPFFLKFRQTRENSAKNS